jgi:hypothetical protein
MTKYIKLFEAWQWLNREEEPDEGEREYSTTVGDLLTWAVGPDWAEDWDWMLDVMMVDWDWINVDEAIGYHSQLKSSAGVEVTAFSEDSDGSIETYWEMDGVNWVLITQDWPFSEDGDLTREEESAVLRILRELGPGAGGATTPDVIDWVQSQVRGAGLSADDLSAAGFKNWFGLGRAGLN